MTEAIEVKAFAEQTTLHNLKLGGMRDAIVVRVWYRKPPTRRWTKFFIVPEEGQRVEDLLARATESAEWHASKDKP